MRNDFSEKLVDLFCGEGGMLKYQQETGGGGDRQEKIGRKDRKKRVEENS